MRAKTGHRVMQTSSSLAASTIEHRCFGIGTLRERSDGLDFRKAPRAHIPRFGQLTLGATPGEAVAITNPTHEPQGLRFEHFWVGE